MHVAEAGYNVVCVCLCVLGAVLSSFAEETLPETCSSQAQHLADAVKVKYGMCMMLNLKMNTILARIIIIII